MGIGFSIWVFQRAAWDLETVNFKAILELGYIEANFQNLVNFGFWIFHLEVQFGSNTQMVVKIGFRDSKNSYIRFIQFLGCWNL